MLFPRHDQGIATYLFILCKYLKTLLLYFLLIKFDKQTGRSKPAHYNNFIDMTSLSDAKKKTAKKSLDTCLSEKMELSTTAVGLFILLDDDAIASMCFC